MENEKDKVENGEHTEVPQNETPLAKAARLKRQFQQTLKKLSPEELEGFDLSDITGSESTTIDNPKKQKKTDSFDYGQLAYLKAFGIDSEDEIQFALEAMQETGKELKDLMSSNYFNSSLSEFREQKSADAATAEATKDGTRPQLNSTQDPQYWVKKGELPPNTPENQELRRQVVNARVEQETAGSKFTDTPVVT